jgi:hypothetical protein
MEPLRRPLALIQVAVALALIFTWGVVGLSASSNTASMTERSILTRTLRGSHAERVTVKLTGTRRAWNIPTWRTEAGPTALTASRWRGLRRIPPRSGLKHEACDRKTACQVPSPQSDPPLAGSKRDREADRRAPGDGVAPQTPAASTTAASTPHSSSAPAGGPVVGAQFHCNQTQYNNADRVAVLDKLKAAGVSWVRIDTAWGGIEHARKGDRNGWYIEMVDFCVDEARKRGLNVLIMLWWTPDWANGGRGHRVPPANPQDYADFARWAASHWRGRVAAWEVWNEPDPWQQFWQGTTEQYVALLKAAYPAFKAGDPNARVVLGGASSNDDEWIAKLYALGAKGSFDVLATHPYQADHPPEHADDGNRWWFTHLPAVRNVMLRYGDGETPIWFTEFGWSAHANRPGTPNWQRGVTPEQQADYAVRAIRYTRAHYPYVPVMFWYKERASPLGSDPYYEGYGLLNSDLSERPVYRALKRYLVGA